MAELKFKVNDKVVVNGPIYQSANGTLTNGEVQNKLFTIRKAVENAAHPYMMNGIFGWFNENEVNAIKTKVNELAE